MLRAFRHSDSKDRMSTTRCSTSLPGGNQVDDLPPAPIPKVLKSNTGVAGELVGQPAANGQIHKFWTFEFDFLGCYMVKFDESIFFGNYRF